MEDGDDDEIKVTKTSVQIENMELKRSTASQTKPKHILTCTIVLSD